MIAAAILRHLHDLDLVTYNESGLLTGDWPAAVEAYPDQPDQLVVARSTGGLEGDGYHAYDRPTFQLYIRGGPDPRPARRRLAAIYAALQGLHGIRLPADPDDPGDDGLWLVSLTGIQSSPVWIGRDANQRSQYTQNFLAEVRNPSTNRV